MIQTINIGSLAYLVSENIAVPHCFTTRLGGVSSGHLAAMNIGIHRGDEKVLENYRILGEAVGFAPEQLVLTTQTHTDRVVPVGRQEQGAGLFAPEMPECDGLITNQPGVGLVVFTADCTPILLYDPVTGAVGAVHAGWRGTAADIAAKAVSAMAEEYGSRPEDLRAAIGPNIAQCCFETDGDVPQAILDRYGTDAAAFIRRKADKYHIDLKAVNALSLQRAGVRDIAISELCTACRPELFWSHRKMGKNRGSQGAVILCKEGCL